MRSKSTFVFDCVSSRGHLALLLTILLETITFSVCLGQTRFREELEGYELTMPSSAWKAEMRPNASYAHTDFVYGPTSEVRLRIRMRLVGPADTPKTTANRDQARRLQLFPGFIDSSIEPFVGALSGVKVTYEYVRQGRLVAARSYYLKANNRTIYVLRFTGPPDTLKEIQQQTESIAHSFSPI
jgi:hypothetical protein